MFQRNQVPEGKNKGAVAGAVHANAYPNGVGPTPSGVPVGGDSIIHHVDDRNATPISEQEFYSNGNGGAQAPAENGTPGVAPFKPQETGYNTMGKSVNDYSPGAMKKNGGESEGYAAQKQAADEQRADAETQKQDDLENKRGRLAPKGTAPIPRQ